VCQRLAAEGYGVIAPDLFFRSGGTEAAQGVGSQCHIGQDLFGHEGTHQRCEVAGLGATAAEEEVRGDGPVAFGRQTLAHPEELGADAPALMDDDDTRPRPRFLREGDEVGKRDRGHGAILPDDGFLGGAVVRRRRRIHTVMSIEPSVVRRSE
jgi:hypothetical protein